MATTPAASKRTLEGHFQAPVRSGRNGQPLLPAHGRRGASVAGCPEVVVSLCSPDHHLCGVTGNRVLEGLSPTAARRRRRQAARARTSGFMATQSRENRHRQKEESQGEEGVHTEDPHLPKGTTGDLRPQGPTSGSAGPQGALVSVVRSTPPLTPLTRTTRLWARQGAASSARHPFPPGERPHPRGHTIWRSLGSRE